MKRKGTLRELFNIQGGMCAYCEKPMDITTCNKPDSPSIDHVLPKSQFPQLSKDKRNMVCACVECNTKKADMPLVVFLTLCRKPVFS